MIVLWPRVTVAPEQAEIDPSKPLPISFKITNTGFIPLDDFQPSLGVCNIWTGKPENLPDECKGSLVSKLIMPQWHVAELARDESTVIRLDDLFGLPALGGADISITATFKPWFVPYHYSVEYRFQTHVEQDGKLTWKPRPIAK